MDYPYLDTKSIIQRKIKEEISDILIKYNDIIIHTLFFKYKALFLWKTHEHSFLIGTFQSLINYFHFDPNKIIIDINYNYKSNTKITFTQDQIEKIIISYKEHKYQDIISQDDEYIYINNYTFELVLN